MILSAWQRKWGIPKEAMDDLLKQMGRGPTTSTSTTSSESANQKQAQLNFQKTGGRLLRNNSGAFMDDNGRLIRYGLGNISKQVNTVMKSSDLIGIQPILIKPEYVNLTLGQFVAIEAKPSDWKYTGTPREIGQNNFLQLVISLGGRAFFYNGSPHLL